MKAGFMMNNGERPQGSKLKKLEKIEMILVILINRIMIMDQVRMQLLIHQTIKATKFLHLKRRIIRQKNRNKK